MLRLSALLARIAWFVCAMLLLLLPRPAAAAWPDDPSVGVPLCTAPYEQLSPTMASDAAGGAIVAWTDNRAYYPSRVYLQRIGGGGVPQWTDNGIAATWEGPGQSDPTIVQDGNGGAIVVWRDNVNGDLRAQRISSNGELLWARQEGVLIRHFPFYGQHDHAVTADGLGGVIVAWHEDRAGGFNNRMYAQRLSAAGAVLWSSGGVALCTASGVQQSSTVAADGAGGAIVTWQDGRGGSGNHDVYAQRISAAGAIQWGSSGVALCTAAGTQSKPVIAEDGNGGALVVWTDARNGSSDVDIYAQRLQADGAVAWAINGLALCSAAGDQRLPNDSNDLYYKSRTPIIADGEGGAIVVWLDSRGGRVYAQRISAVGTTQWVTDGVALSSVVAAKFGLTLIRSAAGGAIVVWSDGSADIPSNIYAQRISPTGVLQWSSGGVPIATAGGSQYAPAILPDPTDGAIVTWNDKRNGYYEDIYAQQVNAAGVLGGVPSQIILASAEPNGVISPWGAVAVVRGTNQDFVITPDACHLVADVRVDGVSVGSVSHYTFHDVGTDHSIAVTFVPDSVTPNAPTMLALQTLPQTTGIGVSWTAVPGAFGYRVTRQRESEILVYDVPMGSLSFADVSALESTTYEYWVRARSACETLGPPSSVESYAFHYPVLFVHGICSAPAAWNETGASWSQRFAERRLGAQYFADLGNPGADGTIPFTANNKIAVSASRLEQKINEVVPAVSPKVNIVAHSMGGIVSRYAIEHDGYADKVNKLVMMGTPNHGAGMDKIWFQKPAQIVTIAMGGTEKYCLARGEAADDLKPNSKLLRELNYGRSSNVTDEQCPEGRTYLGSESIPTSIAQRYWTIAGTGSLNGLLCNSRDKRSQRNQCTTRVNDGFIAAGSVRLEVLDQWGQNLTDYALLGNRLYHDRSAASWFIFKTECGGAEHYLSSLTLADKVVKILTNQPVQSPQEIAEAGSRAVIDAVQDAETTQEVDLPYEAFEQGPNEVRETPLAVPSTSEATFFCGSNGAGAMTVRLRKPDGTVLTPADTVGNPDFGFVDEIENGIKMFFVTNPQPGNWKFITDSGGATGPAEVGLIVQIKSTTGLDAAMDSVEVGGEARLQIVGIASEGDVTVPGGSVTAQVFGPSGGTQAVELADDGAHLDGDADDGVFGAHIAPFDGAGIYRADLRYAKAAAGDSVLRANSCLATIVSDLDLVVDVGGIIPSVAMPDSGLAITLSLKVRNLGGVASDSSRVEWTQPDVGVFAIQYISLPPQDSVTVTVPWMAVGGDSVLVQALVVAKAGATERRYDNNAALAMIPTGISVVAVEPATQSRPVEFHARSYPNPTRGTATIRFGLPTAGPVSLRIFNVAGRVVATLVDGELPDGEHAVVWDRAQRSGGAAPAGVYFYELRAGDRRTAKQIVVLN